MSLATVNNTLAQQYTADFSTAPTIDKYGFDSSPWNVTTHVTLGGVEYLITSTGNDSWSWNGSAITFSPYGAFVSITRKDGVAFKFYGVKLNYSSASTSNDFKPLKVIYYGSSSVVPSDEYSAANANITIAKAGGVNVTKVDLQFYHLQTLVFDDLIVGPSSDAPAIPAPSFTQSPAGTAVCSGNNATFTATASNATSFQWQQDDNSSFSSPTNLSTGGIYTISTSGTTSTLAIATNASVNGQYFRARATNSTGSTNSTGAQLTVNPKPVVTVAQPGAVCFPATVNLTTAVSANVSGSTFTYFTDAAATTPVGTPTGVTTSGTYYARATASGCQSELASITVTVNPKPVVTVAQPGAVCFPATVNLTTAVSSNVAGSTFTYFTDAAATTPVGTPTAVTTSGTYYARATASGCQSELASITVTVNPKPVVTVAQPGAVCFPATVNLTTAVSANVAGSTFTYFTDAAATTPVGTPTAVTTSGTYYARATASGCQSELASITVTVNPKPVVTVAQPGAVCFPATVNLTTAVSANVAGSTFTYFTDAAATTPVGTPTGVTTSGTYYARATSGVGCVSEIQPINVTVNPLPTPTLVNNGPVSNNQPTVTLTATGGNTYAFSSGASQQGGANGEAATVTQPGAYQVTAISAQGCTATASTTVTGAASQSACRNGTAVIQVVAGGKPVKYEWYRNSITSARLVENPAQQKGTSTSSLTLVYQGVTANYYVRVTDADGTAVVYGPFKATVDLNCNAYGRMAAQEAELNVTLLGNPINGDKLRATVQGAAGKALKVQLLDLSGKTLHSQQWQQAQTDQLVEWNLTGQASGVYLLQAATQADDTNQSQRHTVKVIKP